jgi:hypothetical protein
MEMFHALFIPHILDSNSFIVKGYCVLCEINTFVVMKALTKESVLMYEWGRIWTWGETSAAHMAYASEQKKKLKLSRYTPWRHMGEEEV